MPKEHKLDILQIIEASPLSTAKIVKMFGLCSTRYYRWQKKYYLDNCLDDKRGGSRKGLKRLEDLYRDEVINIRTCQRREKYVVGPETIMGILENKGIYMSHETIRRILHKEGLILPKNEIIKHEYKRFEASKPNEMWQIDIMHVFVFYYGYLYLYSVLDDYSRKIMHWELCTNESAIEAVETVARCIDINNVKPESMLSDRGKQFFTGEGNRIGKFESFLRNNDIKHIVARSHHPQTLGKLERYHRSLRHEKINFFEFEDPFETRRVIKEYVTFYNHERKHKGINRVTPEDRYLGRDAEIIKQRKIIKDELRKLRMFRGVTEKELEKEIVIRELVGNISSERRCRVAV